MEIRPLRKSDDRLEVSRIYEESWKFAYQGIVPQSYLDGIPAGDFMVRETGGKPLREVLYCRHGNGP